jgi:hypothetical protein
VLGLPACAIWTTSWIRIPIVLTRMARGLHDTTLIVDLDRVVEI